MYTPKSFSETRIEVLHELVVTHPFGALVTLTDTGLVANHIPWELDTKAGPYGTLRGHVARANRVWNEFHSDIDALVVFEGADSYITPSWYPSKQQTGGKVVPTWNYAVVHAHGPLRAVEDADWLLDHLHALTDEHERGREAPWRVTDAPAEYTQTMLRAIVGIEIPITRLHGKWKLNQNRSAADRTGVVQGLRKHLTADAEAMAKLMEDAMSK